MTAFYMFRMWFLVFDGESRGYPDHADHHVHGGDEHHHHHQHPAEHAHESGPLMLWPLYALAIPSIMIGWTWIIVPFFGFQSVLEQLIEYGEPIVATDLESVHLLTMGASVIIAAAGIGMGVLFYSPVRGA